MDIKKLNTEIRNGNKQSLYILVGEEVIVRDIYIDHIAKLHNKPKKYVDSVSQILNTLGTNTLFNKDYCYIVYDDSELIRNEKIWEVISKDSNNCLIILYNNIDKRTKFYKKFTNSIVCINSLSTKILIGETKKLLDLDDDLCAELVGICENDYGRLLLEIDKIHWYSKFNNLPPNLSYNQLLICGGISLPISEVNFNLVEIYLGKNIEEFIEITNDVKTDEIIKVLSLLYIGLRSTFLVRGCKSRDVTDETGLNYYIIKQINGYPRLFTLEQLQECLIIIDDTINNIKGGLLDSRIALGYCIVKLLGV